MAKFGFRGFVPAWQDFKRDMRNISSGIDRSMTDVGGFLVHGPNYNPYAGENEALRGSAASARRMRAGGSWENGGPVVSGTIMRPGDSMLGGEVRPSADMVPITRPEGVDYMPREQAAFALTPAPEPARLTAELPGEVYAEGPKGVVSNLPEVGGMRPEDVPSNFLGGLPDENVRMLRTAPVTASPLAQKTLARQKMRQGARTMEARAALGRQFYAEDQLRPQQQADVKATRQHEVTMAQIQADTAAAMAAMKSGANPQALAAEVAGKYRDEASRRQFMGTVVQSMMDRETWGPNDTMASVLRRAVDFVDAVESAGAQGGAGGGVAQGGAGGGAGTAGTSEQADRNRDGVVSPQEKEIASAQEVMRRVRAQYPDLQDKDIELRLTVSDLQKYRRAKEVMKNVG